MMKLTKKSPAKRVLQCLSINHIKGTAIKGKRNRLAVSTTKLIPPSATKSKQKTKQPPSARAPPGFIEYDDSEGIELQDTWEEDTLLSPLTHKTSKEDGSSLGPSQGTVTATDLATIDQLYLDAENQAAGTADATQQEGGNAVHSSDDVLDMSAFKNLQQLQSVQADLRKAVRALVTLRAKSETGSGASSTEAKQQQESDDVRKEIKVVQGSVTLAKEQIDDMCSDWSRKAKLPETTTQQQFEKDLLIQVLSSPLPSPVCVADVDAADHVAENKPKDIAEDKPNEDAGPDENSNGKDDGKTEKDGKNEGLPQKDTAESPSGATMRRRGSTFSSNKELLAARHERDCLARANTALVATLNSIMEEYEEEALALVASGSSDAVDTDYEADDEEAPRKDEPPSLPPLPNHAYVIKTLTATLTSLLEERDRLSQEVESENEELALAQDLVDKLTVENEKLHSELQGTSGRLNQATSDGNIVAAHGRVVSASLVFTRSELTQAKKRIEELERTVIRLQQQQEPRESTSCPAEGEI